MIQKQMSLLEYEPSHDAIAENLIYKLLMTNKNIHIHTEVSW